MSENIAQVVDTVRRFNRVYTQRIGVLEDSFLGTGYSLGAARVLFEIGAEGVSVLELRSRLRLDSGYLSRLLRQLDESGSVEVVADPVDRRRRVARLTVHGRRKLRQIEERNQSTVASLVAELSPRLRSELEAALGRAEHLVRLATIQFDVGDAGSPDAQWAVGQYFAEINERFPGGFHSWDALEGDVPAYAVSAGGAFVLARSDEAVVGCGGLVRIDDQTAEIKRMWVHPAWRGGGVAWRLLSAIEENARESGYRRVVLDTNPTLVEAIAMYKRAGYRPTPRYNDNPYAGHWFEKSLGRHRSAEKRNS